MRALKIRFINDPLLIIRRSRRWKKRMVYILAANISFKYRSGERPHIICIGTTGKGGRRPKASEAFYDLSGHSFELSPTSKSFLFRTSKPVPLTALSSTSV